MFSELIFGKDLESVTLGDLNNYFQTRRAESDRLEFKSYVDKQDNRKLSERNRDKLNAIIKTTCGFLNSDGGIVIWGAPIKQVDPQTKEEYYEGQLTPIGELFDKEFLIGKITDSVSPLPRNVKYHRIEVEQNKFIYIIEVQKSDYAPHQFNGTYYVRIDGATRIAPHYLVEAMIKKIQFPKLYAKMGFGDGEDLGRNKHYVVPVIISIVNLSPVQIETDVNFRISCDGCDFIEPLASDFRHVKPTINKEFHWGSQLHYAEMRFEEKILVTRSLAGNGKPFVTTIFLSAWGKTSPIIQSIYDLKIEPGLSNKTSHKIDVQAEGVYSFDRPGHDFSEKFIADGVAHKLEQFMKTKEYSNIYINLRERH